jgi:hypothetical protein
VFKLSETNIAAAVLIETYKENTIAALLNGVNLTDDDRSDLLPLLDRYAIGLKSFDIIRILPVILQIASTDKDWRVFLTVANIDEFLLNNHVMMMHHYAKGIDEHKLFQVDFEAEYLTFLARCFVVAYKR